MDDDCIGWEHKILSRMIHNPEGADDFGAEVNTFTKDGWEPYSAQVTHDGDEEHRFAYLYVVFLRRKISLKGGKSND